MYKLNILIFTLIILLTSANAFSENCSNINCECPKPLAEIIFGGWKMMESSCQHLTAGTCVNPRNGIPGYCLFKMVDAETEEDILPIYEKKVPCNTPNDPFLACDCAGSKIPEPYKGAQWILVGNYCEGKERIENDKCIGDCYWKGPEKDDEVLMDCKFDPFFNDELDDF